MDSELARLVETEARLRQAIRAIVKKRITREKPLSWRMMFEIEDEAIAMLLQDGDIDLRYINMMASPSAQRRPGIEQISGKTDLYPTHTALWMIQEVYYREAY